MLARGLAQRLVDLKAASERLDRFAFDTAEEAPQRPDGDGDDDAALRDLVLRALARAVDPVNFDLIARLSIADTSVGDLALYLQLPRTAVSERINDLLQVGLVGRTHRGDSVGLTSSGRAVFDLVASIVERGQEAP